MRQRLHTYGNRIWRDERNFVKLGNHKICQYNPETDSLQFQIKETSGGSYVKRIVEVKKTEFIERLKEVC